jgi:hypothetical protein
MNRHYQVLENDRPIDGTTYGNLIAPCTLWEKSSTERRVVEIELSGEIVRELSPEECEEFLRNLRSPQGLGETPLNF